MNEKYQIVCDFGNNRTASLKALSDVSLVAGSLGFRSLTMKEKGSNKLLRFLNRHTTVNRIEHEIRNNSIVLLQYPIYYRSDNLYRFLRNLKMKKGCRVITVIHDINCLREENQSKFEDEIFSAILEISNVCIVHNEVMQQYLTNRIGYKNKVIPLEVFDYIYDINKLKPASFMKSIIIAGNLDTKKAGYLKLLGELDDLHFDLYGINFDHSMDNIENIEYHGAFPSDEIPQRLNSGFGLVWDGDSIEGCTGLTGEYLKINNPHKLSLYLVAGIPVVIWKQAAEAKFVEKYEIGFCVNSLSEIADKFKDLSQEDYNRMVGRVKAIQKQLASGAYTRRALGVSLKIF